MKSLTITFLFSAISFCCLAQTPFTEQTLLDMNKRLMQDFTKFVSEEVSPEYSFTTADGAVVNYQVMKDAKIKAVEWNTHDLKIKQIGNVAIVRGINDHIVQSTTSNEKYSVHFIYTFEYKKDKWLWLTAHHIYNNPSKAEAEAAIKTVIEAETKAFHDGNTEGVRSYWRFTPQTRAVVTTIAGQTLYANNGDELRQFYTDLKPDNITFSNTNYNIKIHSGGNSAYVTYDETSNDAAGKVLNLAHGIKYMERVNGVWKVAGLSVHQYKPKTSTNQANLSTDVPTIQKGNMVGIRTITVELKPNVTMDQVLDFYNTKWIPDADKYFGWKFFVSKCLRGTACAENKLLMIAHFKTEADRDKYFKMAEGGRDLNELGQKAWAQFAPTNDALKQLATVKEEWADWVIK